MGDVLRAAAVAGAGVGAAGRGGGGLLGHGWRIVLNYTVELCGDGEACD